MLPEWLHWRLRVFLRSLSVLFAERIDALKRRVLLVRGLSRLLELNLGITLALEHPETLIVHLLEEIVYKIASCVLVLLVVQFIHECNLAVAVGLLKEADASIEVLLPAGLGIVGRLAYGCFLISCKVYAPHVKLEA